MLLNHYRVALDLELVACLVLAKVGKVDPGKAFLRFAIWTFKKATSRKCLATLLPGS